MIVRPSPLLAAQRAALLETLEGRIVRVCPEFYRSCRTRNGLSKGRVDLLLQDLAEAGAVSIQAKDGYLFVRPAEGRP